LPAAPSAPEPSSYDGELAALQKRAEAHAEPTPTEPNPAPSTPAPKDPKGVKQPSSSSTTTATPAKAPPAPSAPAAEPPAPTPAPAPAPAPTPAPAPKAKLVVPTSAHVHVAVPAGLQTLLDQDLRMQPWVNRVMAILDDCYAAERAKDATAQGAITVKVTMHLNARPDADVLSLPPALSGVVACATGKLLRAERMPLFTGPEGQTHQVAVHFAR